MTDIWFCIFSSKNIILRRIGTEPKTSKPVQKYLSHVKEFIFRFFGSSVPEEEIILLIQTLISEPKLNRIGTERFEDGGIIHSLGQVVRSSIIPNPIRLIRYLKMSRFQKVDIWVDCFSISSLKHSKTSNLDELYGALFVQIHYLLPKADVYTSAPECPL